MCDKLVFDLAQEIEGSPNVFVRKDWINILDNQNQNYNSNQSVIDTSQLSNSNKYMSYREAYLNIPFLITLGQTAQSGTLVSIDAAPNTIPFKPATAGSSADKAVGLKNWFGQIIHSFTLDYNGTTIIQQTPFVNMWNSFKLMTSLSYGDLLTQGPTIGFYPDDHLSWQYNYVVDNAYNTQSLSGQGTSNNTNLIATPTITAAFNNYNSGKGNSGFINRQTNIVFDIDGVVSDATATTTQYFNATSARSLLASANVPNQLWKSYISQKLNSVVAGPVFGRLQYTINATVYLKHIHSFFNMCPLLKGVFLKMTMNLNNTTTEFKTRVTNTANINDITTAACTLVGISCSSVQNSVGGVNPVMIASAIAGNAGTSLFPTNVRNNSGAQILANVGILDTTYRLNLSVGATCLDSILLPGSGTGMGSKSINLYIPSYTFNPVFEQAYLSSPVKQIKYTDIYQYQVLGVASGQQYNNLLTNGISNIKSVLLLPFYSTQAISTTTTDVFGTLNNTNTGFVNGVPVWQSPFDPAGCGPTSPLIPLTNFNIQVSGQNAIYNMERYTFEHFNNQFYGQNAVNGGLTDGLTSGLVDRNSFDLEYCYYYTNIERMLPVDLSVPKSIQVTGTNLSAKSIDIICFIEYGCEISIDALTGARV